MKSVVIFDMDGTLIDTESVYLKAYQEVFQARGIEFTDQEYIDQHAGRTAAACLQ
ncbi:HAD hydrolase-like protein, partial [Streptococcus anginosus]